MPLQTLSTIAAPLPGRLSERTFAKVPSWTYRQSFFGGAVGLSHVPEDHRDPEQSHGDLEDPGLDDAAALLREVHPAFFDEFPRYVAVVHPVIHARVPADSLSSNSSNSTLVPPGILLTVTRPSATAEAYVHEMAHQKLFAFGITVEQAGNVLNVDGTLAFSAAVGRDRPIPAILHAAYSFLHMLELDLAMLERGTRVDEVRLLVGGNLRVARETMEQLRRHARPTEDGRHFMSQLADWASALFNRAELQ